MAVPKKRVGYSDTEEGKQILQVLMQMTTSDSFNTGSSYSTDTEQYPDNLIPFVNRHMNYLVSHPSLDANQYIANVKLVTRIR